MTRCRTPTQNCVTSASAHMYMTIAIVSSTAVQVGRLLHPVVGRDAAGGRAHRRSLQDNMLKIPTRIRSITISRPEGSRLAALPCTERLATASSAVMTSCGAEGLA